MIVIHSFEKFYNSRTSLIKGLQRTKFNKVSSLSKLSFKKSISKKILKIQKTKNQSHIINI